MTIDPRIPTMPKRSTASDFHRPAKHGLHQARSSIRCWAGRVKGEPHPAEPALVRGEFLHLDDSVDIIDLFRDGRGGGEGVLFVDSLRHLTIDQLTTRPSRKHERRTLSASRQGHCRQSPSPSVRPRVSPRTPGVHLPRTHHPRAHVGGRVQLIRRQHHLPAETVATPKPIDTRVARVCREPSRASAWRTAPAMPLATAP